MNLDAATIHTLDGVYDDADGDGDLDLFTFSQNDSGVLYFHNDGESGLTHMTGSANPLSDVDLSRLQSMSVADLDSDGDLDLFFNNNNIFRYYNCTFWCIDVPHK